MISILSFVTFNKLNKPFSDKQNIYRVKGISDNLLFREFKKVIGDNTLLINHLVLACFSIFFIYDIIKMESKVYFFISIMLLIPNLSSTTFSLYSYEGEKIKLINSLPMKKNRILLNEIIVSNVLVLPIVSLNLLILYLFQYCSLEYFALILISSVILSIYKNILDVTNPIIDFDHTKQLLEDKRKYKVWIKVALLYSPVFLYPILSVFNILLLEILLFLVINYKNMVYLKN